MRRWRQAELLLQEICERRFGIGVPHLRLLLVCLHKAQELHERPLGSQIEGAISEDVLTAAGYTRDLDVGLHSLDNFLKYKPGSDCLEIKLIV